MTDDKDEFVSLATLYFEEGIPAGSLASAIEQQGVGGWDRFDRYRLFKDQVPEEQRALDRLARQHAQDTDPERRDDNEDLDPTSDPLFFFGWKRSECPIFAEYDVGPKPPRRRSDAVKIEKTELMILGALLYVIEGNADCRPHPGFATAEKLIAHVVEHFRGYRGISKRTLEQRFAQARALIEKPE